MRTLASATHVAPTWGHIPVPAPAARCSLAFFSLSSHFQLPRASGPRAPAKSPVTLATCWQPSRQLEARKHRPPPGPHQGLGDAPGVYEPACLTRCVVRTQFHPHAPAFQPLTGFNAFHWREDTL